MDQRVERAGLLVSAELAAFVEDEALPGTGLRADSLWEGLAAILAEFAPENARLLELRAQMQHQIDTWHMRHREGAPDMAAYRAFLAEIGYLVPDPEVVQIDTTRIDPEIATIAGPQLVVPVTNARYALNAANARWGSLYDALYGTDALGSLPTGPGYDPERGAQVIAWAKAHLDRVAPLATGSWAEVTGLHAAGGALMLDRPGGATGLADPAQFAGHAPGRVLLRVNGLGLLIHLDHSTPVGQADPAGISDIEIEAAISAIMDLEDSVACVDGADKAQAYRNWLGLMRGDLVEEVEKNGRRFLRELRDDIVLAAPDGAPLVLRGRSLLLVRNVGHLMTTPAVLDADGQEVPEGLLDAVITVLCALHDRTRPEALRNSPAGSVYVVKPKMHGPEEVALTDRVFSAVERLLGLEPHTVKLGIMDEERRTSANLVPCIAAARHRIAFINTGFLDRTGDEIHTSMEAGPTLTKAAMKAASWLAAYELRNVDAGIRCGLVGRAQIGKGMWAMPDRMADMLAQKIAHPESGATTAWVPSPTAAVLHATHYHRVDVFARLAEIAAETGGAARAPLETLLRIPLLAGALSPEEIRAEVDNNCQGILGYVVRWVDQGVGCSKVPDINDVGLMEDRATCRISSQALANWLHHGIVDEPLVMDSLRRMAGVVDRQNAGDPLYRPMAPGFDGLAFQAACDLIFKGAEAPSGYTEPALHARRRQVKATLTPTPSAG